MHNSGQQGKAKKKHCSILRVPQGTARKKLEKGKEKPNNGGVAQLGEHLLCKQGVRSSILLISTN